MSVPFYLPPTAEDSKKLNGPSTPPPEHHGLERGDHRSPRGDIPALPPGTVQMPRRGLSLHVHGMALDDGPTTAMNSAHPGWNASGTVKSSSSSPFAFGASQRRLWQP